MHLVVAGFKRRYKKDLTSGDTSPKEVLWWFGYMIGLLEGGLLTQNEHDELSSWIVEFTEETCNLK